MQQKVQVKRLLEHGYAEVFIERQSACSGDCHKCSGCGAQKETVFVRAKNAIGAKPGDKVIISTDDRQIFKAAMVVYIIPLVLLLAGYFAGYAAGWKPGLAAAAGFALGVVLIVLYNRHVERRRPVHFTITARAE